MFEIPDDDDNFWENLPIEDITNTSTAEVCATVTNLTTVTGQGQKRQLECDIDVLRPEPCSTSSKRLRINALTENDNHFMSRSIQEQSQSSMRNAQSDIDNRGLCYGVNGTYRTDCNSNNTSSKEHSLNVMNKVLNRNALLETRSGIISQQAVSDQGIAVVRNDSLTSSAYLSNHVSQQGDHHVEPVRKNRSETTTPKQRHKRKFPGPAGLLPKLSPGQSIANVVLTGVSRQNPTESRDDGVILSSQSTDDVFSDQPWSSLVDDLHQESQEILNKYSIASSLQKAAKKLLPEGKVALMFAVLESVDIQGLDASVTLKDRTGKISGTVHREVVKEFAADLQPGVALVLRQISVVSPTCRTHYLNITPKNIVHLYPHRVTRSNEEVFEYRACLKDVIHTANMQALQQPSTPNTSRVSPELNKTVPRMQSSSWSTPQRSSGYSMEGGTTPFRTPLQANPVRQTTPSRQSYASTGSVNYTADPAVRRQCQAANNSIIGSPNNEMTPTRKFCFKNVSSSVAVSPVLGASPHLRGTKAAVCDSQRNFSQAGSVTSNCKTAGSGNKASCSMVMSSQTTRKTQLPSSGGCSVTSNIVTALSSSVGGRKSGGCNGVSSLGGVGSPVSGDAVGGDELWGDDLSDELLSQLSEEMF
ncbi:uncharacterized protein [Haliotis cracherodii]|uniref:uncharacterized protein n=1 Tax=Haliotis cracherodii TaxID=6455 RepID=UPI0039E8F0A8